MTEITSIFILMLGPEILNYPVLMWMLHLMVCLFATAAVVVAICWIASILSREAMK